MIYSQNSCFDSNSLQEGLVQPENDFSKTYEEQSYPHNLSTASALEIEFQNQLNLEVDQCYNSTNNEMHSIIHHAHMAQEILQNPNWQEMNNFNGNEPAHIQNGHFTETDYTTTPDSLNVFPLPTYATSTLLPNSSISFSNSNQKCSSSLLASLGLFGESASNGVTYDPMLPLNLQPNPPLLKEFLNSLPYANHGSTLFRGVDDRGAINGGGFYQDCDGRNLDNGVFMFTAGEMECNGNDRDEKDSKHFVTERQRRVQLKGKYDDLRKLIPKPKKNDRASIVADAIEYIHELKRTLNELKFLLEKKRFAKERLKRLKADDGVLEKNGSLNSPRDIENPYNGSSLRSSWLHRKSKNSEVDVRIIDDEVNVKLVQQKRVNCLIFISRVLDELQLDLHHVAGGLIGDYYSFLFNSKINEGSIVYASAIADKVIEVVDNQYAAIQPTNS